MNAERQAKVAQVKEISDKLSNSKAIVIAEYSGLTVHELQNLRKELAEKNVELKVYKNRLFKLAAKEVGINVDESLVGPNIYAFGMDDDISPAKILAKFAKEHEALKLKAGTYEGKVIDAEELAVIATLPSYDEALTMLAMSMLAPLKNISVGLNMLVEEGKLESAPAEDKPETTEVAAEEATSTEATEEVAKEEANLEESPKSEEAEAETDENKEEAQA